MSKEKDTNRIAFVLGSMSSGGAERVVSIIANYYAGKGKSVDIITLLSPKCTYNLNKNIRHISLANPSKPRQLQVFDWINGIRKYYKDNRPYRIVSFFAKINIIVLLSLFKNMSDIVVSERNDPTKDGRGMIIRVLTNILYSKAKKVVFQTRWAQSCFNNRVILNSEILPNPVNEISLKDVKKDKTIVNVGKLMEQKNHKLLIIAFSKIVDQFPEYKLVIYGEGQMRDELERLISSLGLSERILLPGWMSNIYNKMATAELFVLSSDYEGFSNALLEAMTIGLPVISTDCAGSNELIVDGENGLLVEIGNPDKMANAMARILSDSSFAREMADKGKLEVKKFSVRNIIGRWEKIIDN